MTDGKTGTGAAVNTDNGREGRPGDRGDAKMRAGIQGIASGGSPDMPTKLKSECSEGYDPCPPPEWAGNVNR